MAHSFPTSRRESAGDSRGSPRHRYPHRVVNCDTKTRAGDYYTTTTTTRRTDDGYDETDDDKHDGRD